MSFLVYFDYEISFKASETLLGIETYKTADEWQEETGFKASETLLGIETDTDAIFTLASSCFKASETLLGIETRTLDLILLFLSVASKPLKPF